MNSRLASALVLFPLIACSTDSARQLPSNAGVATALVPAGAGGAIFPAERGDQVRWLGLEPAAAYWTPTTADVLALERNLRPALLRALERPEELNEFAVGRPDYQEWIRSEVELILSRLDDYRRQYIGLVDDAGRRRILVRCFPGPAFGDTFEFADWHENLAIVSDGGFWYWYAIYDVPSGQLVHLHSNGYA